MSLLVVAYSYIRFSSPEQAKGDSLRRQTEKAEEYCRRRGWTLANLTLRDLGVSAFRGKNALVGNLGTFLGAVSRGLVAPGSVLIVESLDRISRQGIDAGYDVVKSILKAGVRIVTLTPEREFGPEAVKSLSKGALELQLILERAAEESETKAERVSAAWARKRVRLRERGEVLTRQLPAWVEERGGKLVLIPERAAAARRVFELAAAGYSQNDIVRRLKDEGVKPFGEHVVREGRGRSKFRGEWLRGYVAKLLRDRRTLGEFVPCGKGRKPDGPPIPGYFPAAVTQREWDLARAGARQRAGFEAVNGRPVGKKGGRQGRRGDQVNLFAGLLRNARDGGTYYAARRPAGSHLLVNTAAVEEAGRSWTFPYETFERAVLACLKEIDPAEVVGREAEPDDVRGLDAELARVREDRVALEADLAAGYSAALANVLRQVEARERELDAKLQEAWVKAATPLGEAWKDAKGLLEALDGAPDPEDARLRLRSCLRHVVDSVWLLVVPRGPDRLCAVQFRFAGQGHVRDYLVFRKRELANQAVRRESQWRACSLAEAAVPGADLRDRGRAAALADTLGKVDTGVLWKLLEKKAK